MINGLVYEDQDLQTSYAFGPNSTVMFYVAAKVLSYTANYGYSTGDYYSIHRTYPGIIKNSTSYDGSTRPWFTNAPVGGFYLYGPYRETFTRQLVLTLSSKRYTGIATVVNAAVLLLSDLERIVTDVKYPNNGFGVIIQASTNKGS